MLYVEYEVIIKTLKYLRYFEFKDKIKGYYFLLLLAILAIFTPRLPDFLPFLIIVIMIIIKKKKCLSLEKICNKWRKYDVFTFFKLWIENLAVYDKWCEDNNLDPISYSKLEDESIKMIRMKLYSRTKELEAYKKMQKIGFRYFDIWISYLEKRCDINFNNLTY